MKLAEASLTRRTILTDFFCRPSHFLMGNLSPRHSKSYHEGFSNHLTLTPNRSSWKKQLQIINDTFNIKKISLRHTHGKGKRSSTTTADNAHLRQHSYSIQNFHDLTKKKPANRKQSKTDQQQINVKKSFSLFSIKQPLNDLTNKEPVLKSVPTNKAEEVSTNSTTNIQMQPRPKSRVDLTTGYYEYSSAFFSQNIPK